MHVVSTNTGKTTSYEFQGAIVRSSMRRSPTLGELRIRFDHVEGDKFAVPKIHGIKEAVVYAFSASTFKAFTEMYDQVVEAGNVGENLTIDSLDESQFIIGDEYEVGTSRLRVSGPRYPCNRLNFCFQRADAMDLFAKHRRPGVYFEVLREGDVSRGDELKLISEVSSGLSVLQLFDHLTALKDFTAGRRSREDVREIARSVARNKFVPEFFRARFQKML